MKIVFFGTDENSRIVLDKLLESGHTIKMVITAKDKIRSRGSMKTPCAIKRYCRDNKITCFEKLPSLKDLSNANPHVIIIASYGKIIPDEIINYPKYGAINVHPSLLPKYRGPSPVRTAILNGDRKAGVSIIAVDSGIDSGPVIRQTVHEIYNEVWSGNPIGSILQIITKELFELGSGMILGILETPELILQAKDQNHSLATMTKKISKEDGHIDWQSNYRALRVQMVAMGNNPGVYSFIEKKRLKILDANCIGPRVVGELLESGAISTVMNDPEVTCSYGSSRFCQLVAGSAGSAGQIFVLEGRNVPSDYYDVMQSEHDGRCKYVLFVFTGDGGAVSIRILQPENRAPMTAESYINGYPQNIGKFLS